MTPRVLLVDDQDAFRAAARELLEHGGFDVVGEATSVAEALRCQRELRPEVVLLDVRLPDGTGLELARAMTRTTSRGDAPPAVVLVSTADYRYAVRACGATGFLLKAELSVEALLAVLAGAA